MKEERRGVDFLPGDKIKPPPLRAGDLIAVVAPAGPVHEAA